MAALIAWLRRIREACSLVGAIVELRAERARLRREVDLLSPHVEWLHQETRKGWRP